ncbi:MAG: hypothetical protein WCE63_04135 [Acidobacteriaceae bacterium]
MATERSLVCRCKAPQYPGRLFSILHDLATQEDHLVCESCSSPQRLHLTFDFALGAGPRRCEVLAAFLPDRIEMWLDHGMPVSFYPFLVVLRQENGKRTVWLPYWHEAKERGKVRLKYGQWAPFMDDRLFVSLLVQATQGRIHPRFVSTPNRAEHDDQERRFNACDPAEILSGLHHLSFPDCPLRCVVLFLAIPPIHRHEARLPRASDRLPDSFRVLWKSLEGIPLPTADRRPHRASEPPLGMHKNPFRKRAQSSATLGSKLIFIWDLELAGWRNGLSG